MPTIKEEVLKELNENYDLSNYEICKELHRNLLQKKSELEIELDVNSKESCIGRILNEANTTLSNVDKVVIDLKTATEEMELKMEEMDSIEKTLVEHINKLNSLQCALQYMRIIQRIEYLNAELEKEQRKKDDEKCATIFANLCEISRNLADSSARNLRAHLKGTLHHWHDILKLKLTNDFNAVLSLIKWPFVSENFSLVTPNQGQIQKLQLISEYLLQIQLPIESVDPVVTSALLSDFPPPCLPIQVLVVPLRKRFLYHFYGARQTNRVDKPEWYFTQILTWIRDHVDFVVRWIQPVIDKLGFHHIAKLELMRSLIQLAVEKLYSDLPTLQYDDSTFSHSVDEALGFDKELRVTYEYPKNQPSILTVLTQAQVFVKWMAMEKKYATEKMDVMLSESNVDAFEPLTNCIEDQKIPACADAFITLLQTITERYESLPQPGHRLQFLQLQLDLLDDFRIRLLQLVHEEKDNLVESRIPMISNGIYYIENVLIDWGVMLHFLNLYYYKNQLEEKSENDQKNFEDGETVFVEILSLYRHVKNDLLYLLSKYVTYEVTARSRNYRAEHWSAMIVDKKDFRSLSLTPSACPIFEVLSKHLHQLQKCLANKLFAIVWQSIAHQLDDYLFENLVLENRFSDGGATQLKYDIERNLLPLFSQFTEKPDAYFIQLVESCSLLNISKGSALLLRETLLALQDATGVEDTRGRMLKEVGVCNFTPPMALQILNRRGDITVYRLNNID